MKRLPTGVYGLDRLIGGGVPEGYMVLLSGPVGSGKTIFGLQYLCKNDDTGIFVSFEEELSKVRESAKSFGWDIEKMEKLNKIRLLKYDPYKFEDVIELLENNIREMEPKRIVLDSTSALGTYVRDIADFRRLVLQIGNIMKKRNCTSIIISEIEHHERFSRFGVEEFVSDGVIILGRSVVNSEYKKHLSVLKMLLTDHSSRIHSYDITRNGFVVK